MVSAVRMGIAGGGWGWETHSRACVNFEGFRPARTRVLRGEKGLSRNLRVSLTMYLPVKTEAPRMMIS